MPASSVTDARRGGEWLARARQRPGERVGDSLHLTGRRLGARRARPQQVVGERVDAADDRHRRARAVVSGAALDEHERVDLRPDVAAARNVAAHARGVLARATRWRVDEMLEALRFDAVPAVVVAAVLRVEAEWLD